MGTTLPAIALVLLIAIPTVPLVNYFGKRRGVDRVKIGPIACSQNGNAGLRFERIAGIVLGKIRAHFKSPSLIKADFRLPVYFDLLHANGNPIGGVRDNCDLAATRAYVATVYLMHGLGIDNVGYSYASGGVAPGSNGRVGPTSPKDRRIQMEFILKGARTNR